jgi:hypothetical protein
MDKLPTKEQIEQRLKELAEKKARVQKLAEPPVSKGLEAGPEITRTTEPESIEATEGPEIHPESFPPEGDAEHGPETLEQKIVDTINVYWDKEKDGARMSMQDYEDMARDCGGSWNMIEDNSAGVDWTTHFKIKPEKNGGWLVIPIPNSTDVYVIPSNPNLIAVNVKNRSGLTIFNKIIRTDTNPGNSISLIRPVRMQTNRGEYMLKEYFGMDKGFIGNPFIGKISVPEHKTEPESTEEPEPVLPKEPELVELPASSVAEKTEETAPKSVEEKIAEIKRRLTDIDRELEKDSLREELKIEKRKLKEAYFGKDKKAKRIAMIEKRIDQLENPFKWYIIAEDKLSLKNFEIMFGVSREDATLKKINEIYGETGKDFEKASIWSRANEISEKEHVVLFSSNGFYMKIMNMNIKELKGKKGGSGKTENRIASYAIFGPGGHELNTPPLDYKEGEELLLNTAKRYQEEQLALFEFESQNLEK